MGTGIEFRILGPLEVARHGQGDITVAGAKQRALLTLLVLNANQPLSTERLVDELWGEQPPPTAAKAVQVHVSRLRKLLEAAGIADEVVVTREGGYALSIDPEAVDAQRFERLLAEGRGALAAGRPELAVAALEDALALWRGPPLAEFAYEPFAQPVIARLDELRAAALEELVEAKLALGGHAEVLPVLEPLIAEHPYRERLRGQLMLALYRSERQADALQAYQDARNRLVEDLGIEPGERLRELEQAVLGQDPSLAVTPTGAPVVASPEDAARGAFVGRGPELRELATALDAAIAGRGSVFLIAGEPGIGKSRLADELIGQARARGALTLVGRCWEAGGAPAYWPWVESLREYIRDSEPVALRSQLGAGAAELAQIVPELRRRFADLPEPARSDPDGARFRLFDAAAEFLRSASRDRPLVLVLDDLHAADAPSLLLLRYIARHVSSMRLLLLAPHRDVDPLPQQPLREALGEMAREPAVQTLRLGALSGAEVADYVALTAAELASEEFAAGVHERAEGNPLFVTELVRLLAREKPDTAPVPSLGGAIPPSVRDVISRRVAHLPEACNRLLELACALGREFRTDVLARAAGVSEEQLLDELDPAMATRVVIDVPHAPGRQRFAHVLIRDTLYERLTPGRRVRLHRLALGALEEVHGREGGAALPQLANHAIAAGAFEKGIDYARRAGDRALELLGYEEAARLYEIALGALESSGRADETQRCHLLLALGDAHARAGETPAAKRAFAEAAGVARRLELRQELALAALGYGGRFLWARAGHDARVVPLLEEGLAALGDEQSELRVRLLARLAGALRDQHARERRDALTRTAVEVARRLGDAAALAHAINGRAAAIIGPDTLAECLELGMELRELSERSGDPEQAVAALNLTDMTRISLGDLSGGKRDLQEASRIAHDLRQPILQWLVLGPLAMVAAAEGKLDEAEQLGAQAFACGERALPEAATAVHRVQDYILRDFRGGLEDIAPAIRELAVAGATRPVFRCLRAHLHVRIGDLPEARRELDELVRDDCGPLPFDQEWLFGMSLLAETCTLAGGEEAASVLYRLLLPWAHLNVVDQGEGIRGSVAAYLGMLATVLRRWSAAEAHFEAALQANRDMGLRPWLAYSQERYARMLQAQGGRDGGTRAGELARDALATYRELGMDAWAARAEDVAGAVGARG